MARAAMLALVSGLAGCALDAGGEFDELEATEAKPGGGNTPTYEPMHVEFEKYFFNGWPDDDCIGEDQAVLWSVAGSLNPGESYTFTRQVPSCLARAQTAVLTWDRSELELTAHVPPHEYTELGLTNWQPAKDVIAPNVGNSAQVCAFTYTSSNQPAASVSYTIRNVGTETAYEVRATGDDHNDWEMYFRGRCFNADFDGDGFSDYYEHGTADLVQPYQHSSGNDLKSGVSVSFYESAQGTSTPGDEVDFYPADFDDDGAVTSLDRDRMTPYLGQGTGLPLGRIDANGGPNGSVAQAGLWRRFDLNADGLVDQDDLAVLDTLIGTPIPATVNLAPTVPFLSPADGTAVRGDQLMRLDAQPFDERAIVKLEYLVDGAVVCTKTAADAHVTSSTGFVSGTNPWPCLWRVPKGGGSRSFAVWARVTDGIGATASSAVITLLRQR